MRRVLRSPTDPRRCTAARSRRTASGGASGPGTGLGRARTCTSSGREVWWDSVRHRGSSRGGVRNVVSSALVARSSDGRTRSPHAPWNSSGRRVRSTGVSDADEYASLSPLSSGSAGAGSPGSTYRDAHALLVEREPAAALEIIEPALDVSPADRGLRSLRAWAFLMRAQLERAESELTRLVEDDPSDAWARHALGRSLERQSRQAEALPHLRLAEAMTGDAVHGAAVRRVEAAVKAGA
ncbi:tetratricopeptide repeat protein [Nocardioidaceae bacterium]|nr:tetratricopeptide repeat protein [Nocardioidaceae bacterium]